MSNEELAQLIVTCAFIVGMGCCLDTVWEILFGKRGGER